MSTLVIKNDGLGDLVVSSGLISDLAEKFGPLDLITCAGNREVAESIEPVRQRFYVSRDEITWNRWAKKLSWQVASGTTEDREVFNQLRRTEYDRVICLRRFIRRSSMVLMALSRSAERYCAWQFPTNISRDEAVFGSKGWTHYEGPSGVRFELDYYRGFLESCLKTSFPGEPRLQMTRSCRLRDESNLWGLCVGGRSTNWPVDSWVNLARLLDQQGRRLVLFGGSEDRATGEQISRAVVPAANLIGAASLAESIPWLERLELLISNDTGFAHFATLATRKVLVILGGGTFGRFLPWTGRANQFVIHNAMDCYDCDWQCIHSSRRCLESIPPENVAEYAAKVVGTEVPNRVQNLNSSPVRFVVGWKRSISSQDSELIAAGNGTSAGNSTTGVVSPHPATASTNLKL